MKTLKKHKLIWGISLLLIGIVLGSIAKNNSSSLGGIYLFAEKSESTYFFKDINGEEIYISSNEYIIQNLLTWVSCVTLVLGSLLIFIFWISLTIFRVKNRKLFK